MLVEHANKYVFQRAIELEDRLVVKNIGLDQAREFLEAVAMALWLGEKIEYLKTSISTIQGAKLEYTTTNMGMLGTTTLGYEKPSGTLRLTYDSPKGEIPIVVDLPLWRQSF